MTSKVKLIFYINIALFLIQLLTAMLGIGFTEYFALYNYRNEDFMPHQLVTHMFLHGGFIHIIFNMLALISLAPAVESEYGEKKFLIYYFLCGLSAAFLHMFLIPSNAPMVGASGAIYGMMSLFAIIHPNQKLYFFGLIGVKSKWLVTILILLEMYLGFSTSGDGIAHLAHVGGALAGALFGFYEKYKFRF